MVIHDFPQNVVWCFGGCVDIGPAAFDKMVGLESWSSNCGKTVDVVPDSTKIVVDVGELE